MVAALRPISTATAAFGSRALRSARARIPAGDAVKARRLNTVVDFFHFGYRHACQAPSIEDAASELSTVESAYQGFAFEGAAMAYTLLDALSPWRRRALPGFLQLATRHTYVVHVGVGWGLARLGACEGRRFNRLDPLLRWLAVDGAGFHDGYTHGWTGHGSLVRRSGLSAYGARAFDQGLGRSLWFTTTADTGRIAAAIAVIDPLRQPDLWSGVGLACAYAGAATPADVLALRRVSGAMRPYLAQGVAFACEAHARAAGSAPAHTELAAQIICRMPAASAAAAARDAAGELVNSPDQPAYETWRARLHALFTQEIP